MRGKGVWKFNTSLLTNQDYINIVNKVFDEEKVKYALPVYRIESIPVIPEFQLQLTVDDNLFLEVLLLRIRGETIKFSTRLKKEQNEKEQKLQQEIEKLESNENLNGISDLLQDKKSELENLRNVKIKGSMIRSRIKWLGEGEKPTKYFCGLENKNCIDKIIKKIELANGNILTYQKDILNEVQKYYTNLFANKDSELHDFNLNELLCDISPRKLTIQEMLSLEGKLTIEELGKSLKNMKNNKTPGIDGFPAEFFKMFWKKIKYFIMRSLNHSYINGSLSISATQCIITCLPKGQKSREYLKNWRPLSMLSVIYKLASASLANRLKNVLESLVSKSQTGFVPGRYIGESTRLIYDIMHITEINNIPGLLMLIDFEKAFDSISWSFLYKVLEYFKFGTSFIKWIKLLNTNIKAYIIQYGVLSSPLTISRGCKQGDPISAYLFIICTQILYLLIDKDSKIKGINIGTKEFKISQFADDTTLLLDGSRQSLQAALNLLEIYGSMSGLRINKDKTKIIWIGLKKHSKDKLHVTAKLEWGKTDFNLLGLDFSTDLAKMLVINFDKVFSKLNDFLKNWKKRNLTPFGRITIIKTYVISKFNHLFLALPSPKKEFIKKLESLIFNYLWDGKPDKVKREIITNDYVHGGLKMLNLNTFISSLKITWVRRLIKCNGSQWVPLFEYTVCSISKLINFGVKYFQDLLKKITNTFWKDVIIDWIKLLNSQTIHSNEDIMKSPIWYNHLISNYPLYIRNWDKVGIKFVSDIVDKNGNVLSIENLNHKYNTEFQIFDYIRVKGLVKKFIETRKSGDAFEIDLPYIPQNLLTICKSSKGTRDIYKTLRSKVENNPIKLKWDTKLGLTIEENEWKQIFKNCFYSVYDNFLIWFQYRLIYRILGTNQLLNQINISPTATCRLCGKDNETIMHLFIKCEKSREFWKNIEIWITSKTNQNINIYYDNNPKIILFGYSDHFSQKSINSLLIAAKLYIFQCATKNKVLNIFEFQEKFVTLFHEQEALSKFNFKNDIFERNWSNLRSLLH